MERWKLQRSRNYNLGAWLSTVKSYFLAGMSRPSTAGFDRFLSDRLEPHMKDVLHYGAQYVPLDFDGESILTLGRTLCFIEAGVDMVVIAPLQLHARQYHFGYLQEIQEQKGVPIISTFYDGEEGANERLRIYLKNIK